MKLACLTGGRRGSDAGPAVGRSAGNAGDPAVHAQAGREAPAVVTQQPTATACNAQSSARQCRRLGAVGPGPACKLQAGWELAPGATLARTRPWQGNFKVAPRGIRHGGVCGRGEVLQAWALDLLRRTKHASSLPAQSGSTMGKSI